MRQVVFRRPVRPKLVSLYQVDAMESALAELGVESERFTCGPFRELVGKVVKHTKLVRNLRYDPGRVILAPVLRRSEGDLFPTCYQTEIIPWSFDVWPHEYDQWEDFYRRIRARLAFISARDSARELQRRLPDVRIVWSPEATDPREYKPDKPLSERRIGVLELGRRSSRFHQALRPLLASRSIRHLFELVPGQKIFDSRDALSQGLGDSIVSICFPASITHPEAAGGLETATHRYFESIASKCVPVGHAPAELIELFGYNPVIELAPDDPVQPLLDLLANVDQYQALVERNYHRLLEVGTWRTRAAEVIHEISR